MDLPLLALITSDVMQPAKLKRQTPKTVALKTRDIGRTMSPIIKHCLAMQFLHDSVAITWMRRVFGRIW